MIRKRDDVRLCSEITSEAFTLPGAMASSFMRGKTAVSCPA